jgi:hypothetical protein
MLRASLERWYEFLRQSHHVLRAHPHLLKWVFIFWAGTVVPLAGLMIALTRL